MSIRQIHQTETRQQGAEVRLVCKGALFLSLPAINFTAHVVCCNHVFGLTVLRRALWCAASPQLLLDAWQLFTTIISPEMGWDIHESGMLWKSVNVLSFQWMRDLVRAVRFEALLGNQGLGLRIGPLRYGLGRYGPFNPS